MRLRIADVLARLRADGLATTQSDDAARAALLAASEDYIPWYIRLAVGLGAWAATAFLLGFIGALVGLENAGARFLVGAVLLGGAVWLRRETKAEFMRQSAVAASRSEERRVGKECRSRGWQGPCGNKERPGGRL